MSNQLILTVRDGERSQLCACGCDREFLLAKSRSSEDTENTPSELWEIPSVSAQGTLPLSMCICLMEKGFAAGKEMEKPRDFVCVATELGVKVPLCLCE